jgi:hypothetical protein
MVNNSLPDVCEDRADLISGLNRATLDWPHR